MPKRVLLTIWLMCISALPAVRAERPLANAGKSGLYARSIEQVLRLAEDQVDLGTAALIVSENWSDLVHGRRYLAALDEMALELRRRLAERRLEAGYGAVEVINEYLFDELGFRSLSEADDPNDLFLHTVLDRRRGYCLSLSVLYLSLAERLGLPMYGVVVPGHFFVRYDDGKMRFNIETTSQGGSAPDEHYVKKFKVPSGGEDSIYLKNLKKIQTLGCFLNNLGNSYSAVGNLESALLALVRAVEINPGLAESRANLGNVYLKLGKTVEATYQYEAAVAINPNDPKVHNNLANAYSRRGWMTYAISEYRQALELDPEFVDAMRNLAIVYARQQRYTAAVRQLKDAIGVKPTDAQTYGHLGDVYSQMGEYGKAMAQYNNALKYAPRSWEAYCGLGLCHAQLGQIDEAIRAYTSALKIRPAMVEALVNLGNIYFERGEYDAAIGLYRRAAEAEPGRAMLYYNLGSAYSRKGDYEQAVKAYSAAVGLDQGLGEAHYGLAFGYYQLQKYELAWKHIQAAKDLGVNVSDQQLEAIKRQLR